MKTSFKISGTRPFPYTVYYVCTADMDSYSLAHRLSLSGEYAPVSFLCFSASCIFDDPVSSQRRLRLSMQAQGIVLSTLTLSPFFTATVYENSDKNHMACGIGKRMDLYKRTFSEVIVTVPFLSPYQEKYSLYAKAGFLF